ncbi:MAG TPA: 1-acyl-sn-glycerol-3-phosphate acyltransferase [Pirellulales bacterium]
MREMVSEKPYRFVPPYRGRGWWRVLKRGLPWYLNRYWGIERVDIIGAEWLDRSLADGHGVLLAANHPRPCDPFVMGELSRRVRRPLFSMASWHLFMNGGWQAWTMRRLGAFSVFREGIDLQAVGAAVDILVSGERPLLIFPEGVVSRTNDRLNPLLEGVALIARKAAARRSKAQTGDVAIHPVFLRYRFHGDLGASVEPVLAEIERRLTWQPAPQLPLIQRIAKVGQSLLSLKEIEYFGHPETGGLDERLGRLIDHLLAPLERQWLNGEHVSNTVQRVKRLRGAIMPTLSAGELSDVDKSHRWRQLADCYLAQQLSWYPPDYLASDPTPERILETVERFEEDLTDRARIHRPLSARVEVGEAIMVAGERGRRPANEDLLEELEAAMKRMIVESGAARQTV